MSRMASERDRGKGREKRRDENSPNESEEGSEIVCTIIIIMDETMMEGKRIPVFREKERKKVFDFGLSFCG